MPEGSRCGGSPDFFGAAGSAGGDAHVGVGMAEHKAGGFGEDYSFGVAQPLFAEADALGREGDMAVFGEIFGVDDHAVVRHSA